jgi:hypothetical protein
MIIEPSRKDHKTENTLYIQINRAKVKVLQKEEEQGEEN